MSHTVPGSAHCARAYSVNYSLYQIAPGRRGTIQTLAKMADLVRDAMPAIREKALELMQSVYASGPGDYVEGVRHFVTSSMVLVGEPDELVVSPPVMLSNILE